jgi:membrane fusion protein, multidrug efflux system
MKKIAKRIVGTLLFLLVIAFLVANRLGYFSRDVDRSGFVSGRTSQILPVRAVIVEPKPLTDLVVSAGSIIPDEQVEISAETSGRIVKIHFSEGSKVQKGDLLVTVNNADLFAQIDRNQHQIRLAEEREQRQRSLLERQGISQQAYDQVYTELSTLKAEAALLQAQLDKTLIRAPFTGVLGLRQVSEGGYISPGMRIVRLARNEPVKIDFSVPERYASYLKVGGKINFRVDSQTGIFEGSIIAIEPVVDQRTRAIPVRAIYPNQGGHIIPGSYARVEIVIQSIDDALQVPAQAVVPEMGSTKVFVYKNGVALPVIVGTGLRTESHVQIVSGLSQGDTVITTGILQMRPGLPVAINEIQPL